MHRLFIGKKETSYFPPSSSGTKSDKYMLRIHREADGNAKKNGVTKLSSSPQSDTAVKTARQKNPTKNSG
jgi:hypothetical protein